MTRIAVPLALVFMCGCADDAEPPEPRLVPLSSCEAAIERVREVAIEQMNDRIDASERQYLAGHYCGSWGRGGDVLAGDAAEGDDGGNVPPPSGGPATGTGTNNQVAGVDEADFVKNDGNYIYLAQNGVFRIIDSWPADRTHELSAVPLEGEPKKLVISGDRALVYVAIGDGRDDWYHPGECTYGYDCDFTGDGTATRLVVFDITDRARPAIVRTVDLSGSLIASRRIGTAVHTVVNQARDPFPEVRDVPDEVCDRHPVTALAAFEKLRVDNTRAILDADVGALVPVVTDSAGATADACTRLYASDLADGASFTTVVSLDLLDPAPVTVATIVSGAGAIYASTDALYMAVPHRWGEDGLSSIHKFRVSERPADTAYLGSGGVRGRVLNQFALDERDGYLRVATTMGHVPDPDVESLLTVLAPAGDRLARVGLVEHIAPGEDIRSVRFDGERAFVVTFKKTDPLFVFDLSVPTAPRAVGELKIPGFSTYLHLIDADHLLSIGYDADDHGDFAYFDGVLLQIFDVSDPEAPALVQRHEIGTRGSSSEALTNHLAFTWYSALALLAVPMTICEGGGDGSFGDMTFSGLMVFDVSVGSGIAERGRVAHPVGDDITCSNWWTQASSAVKRSLFLEDFVYSISDEHLKVQSVDALGTDLVSLDL